MNVLELELESEEMASLNNADRKSISEEIGKKIDAALEASPYVEKKLAIAVARLKPNGWKRASENIKAIGAPAAICSLIIGAFALAAAGWVQAFSRVKDETRFEDNSTRDMAELKGQMAVLRALVASNAPAKASNQTAAKQLLAEAKNKLISPLPESVVQQVGQSFMDASPGNPGAWDVALDYVNYHSSQATDPSRGAALPIARSHVGGTRYELIPVVVNGIQKPEPAMQYVIDYFGKGSAAPQASAARVEFIDSPLPQIEPNGVAEFVLNGGSISLDGMFIRHAVLVGVEVHYSGAPISLEDVTFVNCTFVLSNSERSRSLGRTLLASDKVSFQIAS